MSVASPGRIAPWAIMVAAAATPGLLLLRTPPSPAREEADPMRYVVRRAESLPGLSEPWQSPAWARAETLTIGNFHPRSSDHRPLSQARLLHDGGTLAVIFRVEDRWVVARHTRYQDRTHQDSCVELFAQPDGARGYFNFEMNAGGTLLLWYVENPTRVGDALAEYTPVPAQWAARIPVHASLPLPIEPELEDPTTWTVSYRVPLELFQAFAGLRTRFGAGWRANFYKCADRSSHPHWGAWSDIGAELDSHQPDRFGELLFE